jgi:WD40 repeat protein
MADIFISYSRSDSEEFVQQLYGDLTDHGFEVWWDREAMNSRGRTFLQEIRDAIEETDRLILVISPNAVRSDYVRVEWQYAINKCKVVIPILFDQEFSIIPNELSRLHCPDFRPTRPYEQALAELLRIMRDPVPILGTLYGVDPPPVHFLPREEVLSGLSDTVLADVLQPEVIIPAKQVTTLHGMGGVGKSVLAADFARACQTRRAFVDGIVWVKLGQEADLIRRLQYVGRSLGDTPEQYLDVQTSMALLDKFLKDKNCLFILDDVWEVATAETFMNVIGPRCRLLVTTRDSRLATVLSTQELKLDVLSDIQALSLLAGWANQEIGTLPVEAHRLIEECGNLPLALAMIGATVRHKPHLWANVLDKLRTADLKGVEQEFPNYPYANLLRAIQVSVDALEPEAEDTLEPAIEARYRDLKARYFDFAIFRESTPVPEAVLQAFWKAEGLNEYGTQDVVEKLVDRSLAKRDEKGRITLHNLQFDYIRKQAGDLPAIHNRLLAAYNLNCVNGWSSGPNDGYFFNNLAYHLVEAGRKPELRELLLDFEWLQAKLDFTEVTSLLRDYSLLDSDIDVQKVQSAIRLAAHILTRDKTQLAGQLLGRLLPKKSPRPNLLIELLQNLSSRLGNPTRTSFAPMLKQASQPKPFAWLRPLTHCLTSPGGPLMHTLTGHWSFIHALAVTPDGSLIVSGSSDKTVRVWDLERGIELHTLEGHAESVEVVAAGELGRAVSGSADGVIKVWDLNKGKELWTLEGHTKKIKALAISKDGRQAVSGSEDGTIRVWDLDKGTELSSIEGAHIGSFGGLALSMDRLLALESRFGNIINVRNLENREIEQVLQASGLMTRPLFLTPDGKYAVSGSDNGIIELWNLTNEKKVSLSTGLDHIFAVAVSSEGKYVIGSTHKQVRVFDVKTQEPLSHLITHEDYIEAVAITPDGRRAVSSAWDRTIKVWNLESDAALNQIDSRALAITGLGFNFKDNRAVSVSALGTFRLWDVNKAKKLQSAKIPAGIIYAMAVTSDGNRAVSFSFGPSYSTGTSVIAWDLKRMKKLGQLTKQVPLHGGLAITPDGRFAVFHCDELGYQSLQVWDLKSGQLRGVFTGAHSRILSAALRPDGAHLAFIQSNGRLETWDIDRAAKVGEIDFQYKGNDIRVMAITSDCRYAVLCGEYTHISFLDLERGENLSYFSTPATADIWDTNRGINAIALTPDGKRAVSASGGSPVSGHSSPRPTVTVWDTQTREAIANFSGDHAFPVCSISPDGMTVVTGDQWGQMYFLRLEGASALLDPHIVNKRSGSAISRPEDETTVCYLKGLQSFYAEDYPGAASKLNAAIEGGRNDATAYHLRGLTNAHLNDQAGAEADFTAAIEGGEQSRDIYATRGSARLSLRKLAVAEEDFTTAIGEKSYDPNLYFSRGEARISLKDYPGAEADFSEAIHWHIKPTEKESRAYYLRGKSRLHLGNYEGAEADCEATLRICNMTAERNASSIHNASSSTTDFLATFTAGLRNEVEELDTYFLRGKVRLGAGNFAGAEADLTKVTDRSYDFIITTRLNRQDVSVYYLLSLARLGRGGDPSWKDDFLQAVNRDLRDVINALNHIERGHDLFDEYDDTQYEQSGNPAHGEIRNLAAYIALLTDVPEAVERQFTSMIESGKRDSKIYYLRGLARLKVGDWEGAVADLTEILERGDMGREVYFLRGKARVLGEDFASAEDDLTRAIEFGKPDADVFFLRSLARVGRSSNIVWHGDFRKAIEHYFADIDNTY